MTELVETRTTRAGWAYDATLAVLVLGACLYGVATAVLGPAVVRAVAVTSAVELATVVGVGLAGMVLALFGRLGPVWITAPERTWRSPHALLRGRTRTVRLGSVAVAILVGAIVAAAVPGAAPPRATWGLGAAVVVGLAVAVSAAGQCLDRSTTVRTLGTLLGITAVVLALVATARGPAPLVVVLASTAVALLVRTAPPDRTRTQSARRKRRRPTAPPLWELRRAGAVVDALWMATVMLDGSPLVAVSDAQLAPARRRLTVHAALRPLVRTITSSRVIDLVPLIAVPATVVPVGGSQAGVVALVVLTSVFSGAATRLLDVWVDSPALARTFARSRPPLGSVLVATGLVLTWSYALLACALAGLGPAWAAVATLVAVLTWARRLSGRRIGTEVGALLATPAGAVPVGLAQRVIAGVDVVVLSVVVLPELAPGVALAVSGAAAIVYLATMTRRGR